LRDQAGLAPADIARQRNHWDLLSLLEGAGPPEIHHKAPPGREAGAFPRARTASESVPPHGGGAPPRCRTLSVGTGPRGGGACLQARTLSVDLTARGSGAYSHCRSLSGGGAGGGQPSRSRRFSAGMRRSRPNPALERGRAGRGGKASADDRPYDWVVLGACCPASSTAIPPPCLTPSPERGSPQVAWGLSLQVTPLNSGGESQN
jgi:Notch-like protein